MTTVSRPVIIGVDGSPRSLGAMRYGVAEARRLSAPVELVHVIPDYVAMSPMRPMPPDDLGACGEAILRQAAEDARGFAADVPITTALRRGNRAAGLTAAAIDAPLLVVGRDDRPLAEHLMLGNTAAAASSRASCPVAVVPEEWKPSSAPPTVLVGFKSPAHADELFRDAFTVAGGRAGRILVIHAWKLPTAYDDIIESRIAFDELTSGCETEMETALADWRRAYPEVPVEVRAVHDRPSHALRDASREADLLVIGRRSHGVPAAFHLGTTARTLLRAADCPVHVVPPKEIGTAEDLVLEEAGEARK